MKRENFELEEDHCYAVECEDCGYVDDDFHFTEENMEWELGDYRCQNCGGDVLIMTIHEVEECSNCGHTFDMWEDAYRDDFEDALICEDCYFELDEEDD